MALRFLRLLGVGSFLLASTHLSAMDEGDTSQPYGIVTGRSVAFADLTKNDLGLRCTVYVKAYSLNDLPGGHTEGMVVTQGDAILVNGEFNELGKHFLIVVWFDKTKNSSEPFPIAEEDIDHIVLEK